MSDSLRPPWNSLGKHSGVRSLSLLHGIFPTQDLPNSGRFFTSWATREALILVKGSYRAAAGGNPASRAKKEMEAASRPQGISNNLAWQVNLYPISSRHKIRGLQNFIQWRTLFRNWLLFARHSTRYWGQDVNKTDTRHQRESAEDAAVYHVTVSQAVWNRFVVLGDLSVSSFYIFLKKKNKKQKIVECLLTSHCNLTEIIDAFRKTYFQGLKCMTVTDGRRSGARHFGAVKPDSPCFFHPAKKAWRRQAYNGDDHLCRMDGVLSCENKSLEGFKQLVHVPKSQLTSIYWVLILNSNKKSVINYGLFMFTP